MCVFNLGYRRPFSRGDVLVCLDLLGVSVPL